MYSKEKTKGNPNTLKRGLSPGTTDSPKKLGRSYGGTVCTVHPSKAPSMSRK